MRRAVQRIAAGGLVGFPTRCLYGIGADALNSAAVDRIFAVKHRSRKHPILVLIAHRRELDTLAQDVPDIADKLIQRFWPGQLTLVFQARGGLPPGLTAGSGKIGVRMAAHPVARTLVEQLDGPLTATSANLAGRPGVARIEDLDPEVAARLDLIIDAGPLAGGPGSTVVDVTVHPPMVLRQGCVAKRLVLETTRLPVIW